jgi:hypothetical protein
MAVNGGRIEDLLSLFTDEKRPSITGSINLRAKVEVPPGPPGFLRKLDLAGNCGIGSGRFTNPDVQQPVNALTQSAGGENKKQQAEDPETVLSEFSGQVSVKNGVATLSNVSSALQARARSFKAPTTCWTEKLISMEFCTPTESYPTPRRDSKHWY